MTDLDLWYKNKMASPHLKVSDVLLTRSLDLASFMKHQTFSEAYVEMCQRFCL